MSGYYKNIAVIKEIKKGFSADGGVLSGVVRTEQYGSSLKVEASLINFAKLKEGRYVLAIGDGNTVEVFEGSFDGGTLMDTSKGFAAAIYFVLGRDVNPIAVAVCGNYAFALPQLKGEVVRMEGIRVDEVASSGYHDEAIAEENYYEYDKTNKDGGAVRSAKEQEKEGQDISEDEADIGNAESFFESVKDEVNELLESYPIEENLTRLIEHSRFVKISYDGERYYVFGVIYGDERVDYLCYGVPSSSDTPPESMKKLASFVPLSIANRREGYWLTYQDAVSGKSLSKRQRI